jgi:hypothetical protein
MAMHFTGLAGSISDNAAKSMSEVAPELSPNGKLTHFSPIVRNGGKNEAAGAAAAAALGSE